MIKPRPIDSPEGLHDLVCYNFYSKSPEGKITQLGWPTPNPSQEPEYYTKLNDLAEDIAEVLSKKPDPSGTKPHPDTLLQTTKTVFLAEASSGVQEPHDCLSRFLKDERLNVLPAERYPPQPLFEDVLRRDLQKADLFILLLDDKKNLWADFYLDQAKQHELPIILWHSPELNLNDIEDKQHLQLLRSEDVMVSDLVDLQNEILCRLHPTDKNETPTDVFLFLNHAPEDSPYINALTSHLEQRGIGYVIPQQADEFESVEAFQQDRDNSMLECDALLMLYFDARREWVREQLMLYRRIGVKRDENLKGLGICQLPGTTVGVSLPNLQHISCENLDATYCIDAFLKKVTS